MSYKSLILSAGATLALALAGPAFAQEATATDTMPADAVSGPALWKITDEDTTIYLFGTVHVLPADAKWFDQRIETAFDAADEVVFEIDVDANTQMQQVVLEKAALAGDETLRDLMTAEDRTQYEAALQSFGVPAAAFDKVEPWMAAMTLSVLPLMSAGYNPASGVEMSLNARAGTKQKAALETIEQQIGIFDTLPMDTQLTYLDETVEAVPETAATVGKMVDSWLHGDAVSLAALLNEELDDPELHRRLLSDRNANWAAWLDKRMETPGTVFVAVGAGHLAGQDSVQTLLVQRGVDVTRIWK